MRRAGPPLPRLPLALLALLLPRTERDEVLAEVAAEDAARAEARGLPAARRWLWRQALRSVLALLGRRWWRQWSGFEPRVDAYTPGEPMLGSWIADARYAACRLRARPSSYALLAVLTLAIGVGGTAAVYGVARGVLLDPLPYVHEQEVGVFWKKTDWTEEEFLYLRGRVPGFRDVALYRVGDVTLRDADAPARLLHGIAASAELFDVLGAAPMLGRGFRAGDDMGGAEPTVVLSHALWQELGGEPSIIGTPLVLDGLPRTVVGVMPPGFWFPDPSVRIWTAVRLSASQNWNSTLIGRVSAGLDVRAMTAPLARLTGMLGERFDYPAQWDKTAGAHVTPLRDDILGGMRPALLATLGAMALVLLIACANVAALMLGQVDARSEELAVRVALGASRRRLTQQLLVEAMFVAVGAGLLGTVLAWVSFRMLAGALPLGAWTPTLVPGPTVFLSAMGIAVAAALVVVLVPTASLWRGNLRAVLGRARGGDGGGRGGRLEGGLVVAEVALAVWIAWGGALLLRSVTNLYALNPGVRTEGVGVVDVTMPPGVGLVAGRRTLSDLTASLAQLRGVRSTGAVQVMPLRGGGYNLPIGADGRNDLEGQTTEFRVVTPGYLETMGVGLVSGRTITEADDEDTEPVVVVNEALVRKYFAGIDPLGQYVSDGIDGRRTRIVGVIGDVAERRLTDDPVPVRYVALAQMAWLDPRWSLVLQAAPLTDPAALLDDARRTVEHVAPGVPLRATTTMSAVLDAAVGPARQVVSLLSLLTVLALTLGAVGIYGVTLHFAARRQRDLAVRVALGLTGTRAVARVVAHGALLVAVGIGIGAAGATAFSGSLASLLYGVSPVDPAAFAAAAAALMAVGLVAALIPAARARRTDPAALLREE